MSFVVALTGGIGSGKSTISDHFQKLGIPIIDTDKIARECVEPNTPAFKKIIEHFGSEIIQNNALDRQKLRTIIFNDSNEKNWLESLLHPLIFEKSMQAVKACLSEYCILVVPLLVESYAIYQPIIDRVLVVELPKEIQIERLMTRDHCNQEMAHKMIASQATTEQRAKIADDILMNTSNLEDLQQKVEKLHHLYLKFAKQKS